MRDDLYSSPTGVERLRTLPSGIERGLDATFSLRTGG